jgi:hypothetical protein
MELPQEVKRAGGKWNLQRQVWELRYDQVMALGLERRIVKGKSIQYWILASNIGCLYPILDTVLCGQVLYIIKFGIQSHS